MTEILQFPFFESDLLSTKGVYCSSTRHGSSSSRWRTDSMASHFMEASSKSSIGDGT